MREWLAVRVCVHHNTLAKDIKSYRILVPLDWRWWSLPFFGPVLRPFPVFLAPSHGTFHVLEMFRALPVFFLKLRRYAPPEVHCTHTWRPMTASGPPFCIDFLIFPGFLADMLINRLF